MWIPPIKKTAVGAAAALFCVFLYSCASLFSLNGPFSSLAHAGFFSSDLDVFEETLSLVSKKYVYPPDYNKIFSSAIEEMAKTAGLENLTFEHDANDQAIFKDSAKVTYRLDADRRHDFRAFKKVYYFLLDQFEGSLSKKDLEQAGIVGMMNSLDTYSQYLDKDAFERSIRDTQGQYGGLGMIITLSDNRHTIVKTMKNSPARRARIQPGDIIARVDGKEAKGMKIEELARLLRGPPDSQVTISILRPGDPTEKKHTLTREIISIETVEYKTIGGTGYIKVASFSRQTNEQLKQALETARRDGVRSIVLDLRDNPGGLLNQSVKVASHFLDHGRLVVYTQGRQKSDRQEYRSLYKNNLRTFPIVVIVNRRSASASEIVAGALRDSGRALIIGETSFGKGSVQTIFRVGDDSGLRLTTSKYYTPLGVDITEHGIVPDIGIVDDLLSDESAPSVPTQDPGNLLNKKASAIRIKKSDVEKFLKQRGMVIDEDNDATLLFAHLIATNSTAPDKTNALAKARELAANIIY